MSPNRKRTHAFHFGGNSGEAEATCRQGVETGQMLDNRDLGGKQYAVNRTRATRSVVNVVGIDADQQRSLVAQVDSGLFGEERMTLEILVGPPVLVPAGVNQHCMAATGDGDEMMPVDRAPLRTGNAHDDCGYV